MCLVALGADYFDYKLIGTEGRFLVGGQVHFAPALGIVGQIAHVGALLIVVAAIKAFAPQVALIRVAIKRSEAALAKLERVHEKVQCTPMIAQ